jgi:hypothetical protein
MKSIEINRKLLYNYESLQKQDVGTSKVNGFLDQSRMSYNDWEKNFKN